MDRAFSLQLSNAADPDKQWPTDAWSGTSLGYCIVPGKTKRKDAVHLGRRGISLFRNGARDRSEVEAEPRSHDLDRRHLRHGGRQERAKYKRTSGVDFGPVDVVKYAEAFGAVGFMVDTPAQIGPILKKAFEIPGPVLIGIRVDYRDNHKH